MRQTIAATLIFLIAFVMPLICWGGLFADGYNIPKWSVFFLVGCVSLFFLLGVGNWKIPKISRVGKVFLSLLAALVVMSQLLHWPSQVEPLLLKWVSAFVFLVTLSTLLNSRPTRDYYWSIFLRVTEFALLLVLLLGVFQLFGVELIDGIFRNSFPGSTLGHHNMTAEYIGFAGLCLLYGTQWRELSRVSIFLRLSLVILSFVFLVRYLGCRAVLVALLAVLIVEIFQTRKLYRFWAIAGLGFVLLAVFFAKMGSGTLDHEKISQVKSQNIQLRLIRWMNTLEMIRESPWVGVGPGNYVFQYLNFHDRWKRDTESLETVRVQTPHNGYLELASELGIPAALITVLAGFLLWFRFRRDRSDKIALCAGALVLYLAVVALFAFPLDNPVPFALMVLVCGFSICTGPYHAISNRLPLRVLSGIFVVFGLKWSTGFIHSHWAERNHHYDLLRVERACQKFPANWRTCALSAEFAFREGEFELFESRLEELMSRFPGHPRGVQLLARWKMESKGPEEGCYWVSKYRSYFGPNNSLRQLEKNYCPL